MRNQHLFLVALVLTSGSLLNAAWAEDGQDHHDEGSTLALTASEQQVAGVRIGEVSVRPVGATLIVPGEVTLNAYETGLVSPRVAAQVTDRHARLGDQVVKGAPLVTMSSIEIAAAQGAFIEAAAEWRRVQELGKSVVSDKRYTEAQVAHQRARASLEAIGLNVPAIVALSEPGGAAKANGSFTLTAPIDGTVMEDDVLIGAFVEPGHVLFRVSNELELWVEASLPASTHGRFGPGERAWVIRGKERVEATVIQDHHALSETTRRRQLRLALPNPDDIWHPGEFVEVALLTNGSLPRLAVPSTAITLLDGESIVFAWDGDEFTPRQVEIQAEGNGWTAIAGIREGAEIATEGIYHLKSLLLRSTLGEGHGH